MGTTKGKPDVHPDVSFVSSTQDWSKDLDNIKPYGPSANHGALDPVTGYQAYRTFRFKLIRKLISVGPNLWNTICHYAELSAVMTAPKSSLVIRQSPN